MVREPGFKADPDRDNISVDGRPIPKDVEKIYIALNKPAGWVSTREDPHAENIVMDLVRVPLEQRLGRGNPAIDGLHPVGRLDTQTEGLLLLTNDGAFTQALTHPRHGVPKVYLAEVRGIPDQEAMDRLRGGIPLFGRYTLPARVRVRRVDRSRGVASLEVELKEGRNQQIRRMLQAVGFPVTKLKRVSIGTLNVERLRPKQWRFLTEAEVKMLFDSSRAAIAAAAEETPKKPVRTRPYNPASRGHGPKVEAPKPGGKRPGPAAPSGSGRPGRPAVGPAADRGTGPGPRGPRAPQGPGPEAPRGTGPRPPRKTQKTEGPAGRTRGRRPADSKSNRPSASDRQLRKKY